MDYITLISYDCFHFSPVQYVKLFHILRNRYIISKYIVSFIDSCTSYDYFVTRYKAMPGTGCASFCQCAPLRTNVDGTIDYYWARQDCPATTLFDESINVCNHADQVSCGSTNGPKSKSCFNALYGNTLHLSLKNYIKNKTEHIYYWFRLVNKLHRLTELAL